MAANLLRPKIQIRYGRQNQPVRVPIQDLLIDEGDYTAGSSSISTTGGATFLTADVAAASGTITVKNITGFAINQILLIGDPGNEGSEIIKTHASTAPTGSTITLAANTVFAHSAGTKVRVIFYDQVEFSTATTVSGSKSVLATKSLVADSLETTFLDTTAQTGFYFARWKETINNTFSPYSDAAPVAGYTALTARSLIDNALQMINKKQSEIFSDEYGFMNINNCQIEVLKAKKRWSWMQKFNSNIGTTSQGEWLVAVPTDLDDQNTNKSVWNLRIGKQPDLTWVDKEKWDELTQFVATTTLSTAINVGDTTISLTNSGDFDDSGSITVGQNTYSYNSVTVSSITRSGTTATVTTASAHGFTSGYAAFISGATQTLYNGSFTITVTGTTTFTYTVTGSPTTPATGSISVLGNNRTTNILAVTATTTSNLINARVFQGQSNGEPNYWTTYGGSIYMYPVIDGNFKSRNIYMDYYTALTVITQDSDTAVVPDATLIQYYLAWKYMLRMNNGSETNESLALKNNFEVALKQLFNKDVLGRTFKLRARYNNWSQQMDFPDGNGERIRDANFPNI